MIKVCVNITEMKKVLIIILAGLQFVFTNCNDKPKPTVYLSQSTKDYCRFKESSWWVYKNQFGQKDSNYIFEFMDQMRGSKRTSKIFEGAEFKLGTSFYSDTFIFIIENNILTNVKIEIGQTVGMYYCDNKDTNKVVIFDSETIQLKDTLEEYNNFKKIKIFKVSATMDRFNPLIIYYAKNIGIIRKEMLDGTIWELENYHVLQ